MPPQETPKTPQTLLEDLDEEQRQVVLHQKGALCVLAGAGTGKTRAITYRIAYGVQTGQINPSNVMALSFTQKAAAELRSRLQTLGVGNVNARTFHSAALRQVSYFWPHTVGGTMPKLIEKKASLVAAACTRLNERTDSAQVRDLASEIEWAKVSLIEPENYAEKAKKLGKEQIGNMPAARVAQLLKVYEEVKIEREVLDFEDILLICAAIIEQRPDVARAVRKQYKYFVVDEYQDVSPLQNYLLLNWLGQRRDLCVVGDVAQTIYSFAGATPKFLTDFNKAYPEAKVVKLVRDYRSSPQIVTLANTVLAKAKQANEEPLEGAVKLISQQPDGPEIEFFETDDDPTQATQVTKRIQQLQEKGIKLSDMAILYRTNAQSEYFEMALNAASIPFVLKGGQKFFERAQVKRALSLLRTKDAASQENTKPAQATRQALKELGWTHKAPEQIGSIRERWEQLDVLVNLADEAEEKNQNLHQFVLSLLERQKEGHEPAATGVTLASLHAAKGLEWEAVFLTGLSDGLVPISLAKTSAAREEERRLLYVGITRARKHLCLSFSQSRRPGGKRNSKVCPFLNQIWPQAQENNQEIPRHVKEKRKRGTTRSKEFLDTASPEEKARFEALREWRAQEARQMEKPAFVVFPDSTMIALARVNPRHRVALSAIPGLGPVKIDRWAEDIIQTLRDSDTRLDKN